MTGRAGPKARASVGAAIVLALAGLLHAQSDAETKSQVRQEANRWILARQTVFGPCERCEGTGQYSKSVATGRGLVIRRVPCTPCGAKGVAVNAASLKDVYRPFDGWPEGLTAVLGARLERAEVEATLRSGDVVTLKQNVGWIGASGNHIKAVILGAGGQTATVTFDVSPLVTRWMKQKARWVLAAAGEVERSSEQDATGSLPIVVEGISGTAEPRAQDLRKEVAKILPLLEPCAVSFKRRHLAIELREHLGIERPVLVFKLDYGNGAAAPPDHESHLARATLDVLGVLRDAKWPRLADPLVVEATLTVIDANASKHDHPPCRQVWLDDRARKIDGTPTPDRLMAVLADRGDAIDLVPELKKSGRRLKVDVKGG